MSPALVLVCGSGDQLRFLLSNNSYSVAGRQAINKDINEKTTIGGKPHAEK